MTSTSFRTLERFQQRKIVPIEGLSVFLHGLKQLPEQAMPRLYSLPRSTSCHTSLWPVLDNRQAVMAMGSSIELRSMVEHAKLLTTLENKQ